MVVQQVAEVWLPRAFAEQIDLGFELTPAFVRGNNLLLQELLGNLLDNALRYTPPGGTITVACGQHETASWLSVEDSGPGIAASECDKVFERFYQPAGSRRNGNGLGLAIVREIARQHGGQVVAMASPRLAGALLKVTLPAASTAALFQSAAVDREKQ